MEYLILQAEEKLLTVAHFGISRRNTELIGAAAFTLDDDQTLTAAVRTIAQKMVGAPRVVLCLPPSIFAQRTVKLPLSDLSKVREVLPGHLQGDIAIPIEDLVLDAMPMGNGQFLALWARKTDISAAIEQFRDAGIEPQVITSTPFGFAKIPGVPTECVICAGNTLAQVNAGQLTYFRAFNSTPSPAMVSATLMALEISGAALPPKLCLLGTDKLADIDATLPLPTETLVLPPELGTLFKNEQTFEQLAELYAVALACHANSLPNFRSGTLAWTAGDVKLRKKLKLTGVLAATVIAMMFISKGLQYRAVSADVNSLNVSIAAVYHEIFPARPKAVDELAEIKGEIKKMAGVENSGSYLDSLKKLAEAKSNAISGLYEVELEGPNLRIKGDAGSAQSVNEFKTALSPLLSGSELGEVKSRPDGSVSFRLTGIFKEAAK